MLREVSVAAQARRDGGEAVDLRLLHRHVVDAELLAARLQAFDDRLGRTDQHVGVIERAPPPGSRSFAATRANAAFGSSVTSVKYGELSMSRSAKRSPAAARTKPSGERPLPRATGRRRSRRRTGRWRCSTMSASRAGQRQDALRAAADHDRRMRALHRGRLADVAADVDELALAVELLTRPVRLDERDHFLELRDPRSGARRTGSPSRRTRPRSSPAPMPSSSRPSESRSSVAASLASTAGTW